MPYAHKLTTYEDMPRVKIVYCSVCGQESDLNGPCEGPFVDAKKFERQFKAIFAASPVKASKQLEKIIAGRTK